MLEIETGLKSLGNRSGVVHQVVRLRGTETVVAQADVTFVIVSSETGRAVPLAGELRSLLEAEQGRSRGH